MTALGLCIFSTDILCLPLIQEGQLSFLAMFCILLFVLVNSDAFNELEVKILKSEILAKVCAQVLVYH